MLVRNLEDIENSESTISGQTWTSRRLLLKKDKMGFSMHDTLLHAGTVTPLHYKNHLEAVYCIEGRGELHDLDNGKTYEITPGFLYALDKNDRHRLIAHTQLRMICVFNPPLNGEETHDPSGSYPLID